MVAKLITRGLMVVCLSGISFAVGAATEKYDLGFWNWPRLLLAALTGAVCVVIWSDLLSRGPE